MTVTITVPSKLYGELLVTASISPGRYEILEVVDDRGHHFTGPVHQDVLEDVETAIEFELQCAWYDDAMANMDDLAVLVHY